MIRILLLSCLVVLVTSQTTQTGNPTGIIGSPAFDEIVVESTLTVKGKSGARKSKSLVNNNTAQNTTETKAEAQVSGVSFEPVGGATVTLKRNKRVPQRRRYQGNYNMRNPGYNRPNSFDNFGGQHSSSHANSQGFNNQSPFGNYGASASNAGSQNFKYGPKGFEGSAGFSGSQTYNLPNGNSLSLAYSNGYNVDNGRPTYSNSHAVTLTRPDGSTHQLH